MTEEKNYQDIRTEFEKKYSNMVVPSLLPYNEERKKKLRNTIIAIVVMAIIGIISLCLIPKWEPFKFGTIFLAFAIVAYPISKKNFEGKLKKFVMPIVCGCFSDLKWIDVTREMWNETDIYKTSGLLSDFNSFSYDDCFVGKYNDVGFEVREFEATKETGSGKDKKTQIIFDGVIITLDMNKKFTCNTVLRPHSFISFPPSFKLHKTKLEDVEFNKKFDVYTDDEVEARYVLTTSLMERLNTMQTAFKADKAACSFYNEKFYVALYTRKDLFSIGSLIKDVCDREQFFTMFDEILSIIKLIDHFKLNQKIGM